MKKLIGTIRRITEHREFMLIYIIVLSVIGLSYAAPEFLTKESFSAVLLSLSDQSMIAVGMTILLVAGAFDLSVGSTLALSGLVTAIFVTSGLPVPAAIAIGLATGTLIGAINGLIITQVGINPFITTLGMMSLLRGLVLVVSGGQNISNLPESFTCILSVSRPVQLMNETFRLTLLSTTWPADPKLKVLFPNMTLLAFAMVIAYPAFPLLLKVFS